MRKLGLCLLALFLCLMCWGCGTEAAPSEAAPLESLSPAAGPAVPVPEETATAAAAPAATIPAETVPAVVDMDSGWNQRQLSDETLQKLAALCADYAQWHMDSNKEVAREMISTVPDAIFFLDQLHDFLFMDSRAYAASEGTSTYQHPAVALGRDRRGEIVPGRQDIANSMMWLLEDNLPIGMIYGLLLGEGYGQALGEISPSAALNYIVTTEGYVVFDAVVEMAADMESRAPEEANILPGFTCASLEEYGRFAKAAKPNLWKLCAWTGAGELEFIVSNNPRTLDFLNIEETVIYQDHTLDHAMPDYGPGDIGQYRLTGTLGGLTLTEEDALALVDADPETVREEVKTAADVLLYMLALGVTDSYGDEVVWGELDWHYNRSAQQVMVSRTGNCGSCANLANYLLEGDYEEVGYINQVYYLGGGGGHVYNYIRHEGSYYIVDFSSYVFSGYVPAQEHSILKLNTLEEYGSRFHELYGNVCMVMAYDAPERDYPCVFGMDDTYYWPEGVEYTMLYLDTGPRAYRFDTAPVTVDIPGWNSDKTG